MTSEQARSIWRRSFAVYVMWVLLTGLLVAVGVAVGLQGVFSNKESRGSSVVAAPAVVWLGTWVFMCARVVWTYRRQVPVLAASDEPVDQVLAKRHAAVSMQFTLRDLSGVNLVGVTRTRMARFVDGQWPLVGHVAAIGLIVIAASLE